MTRFINKLLIAAFLAASFLVAAGGTLIASSNTLVHADTVGEIQGGSDDIGGDDPKNKSSRVTDTIRTVVNILSFLIGVFAVIMIVISGFRFVTSNGDSNTISQARNGIIYAVIGLVIAVIAYLLTSL